MNEYETVRADGLRAEVLVDRVAVLVRDVCTVRAMIDQGRIGSDDAALAAWLDDLSDRLVELVDGHGNAAAQKMGAERMRGLDRGWWACGDGETACSWVWADLVERGAVFEPTPLPPSGTATVHEFRPGGCVNQWVHDHDSADCYRAFEAQFLAD